jgi:hypothetical protein
VVINTPTTKESAMSDLTTTIDTHLAAYGEPDPTKRADLVRQVWATDGQLLDPPLEGAGHDGIAALGDIVQAHYAGHTFRRTSAVDAHHGFARYSWDLVTPSGAVAISGLDVVQVDDDGRLVRIVGFFGPLADAA